MNTHIEFSENLIKGRIGETVFEQMLRETDSFTILPFGYEKVLPELARHQADVNTAPAMEAIRRAPDFCVINHETHDVSLIEVKYMMHLREDWVHKHALRISESWKPAFLFIASPSGFYFGKASEVVASGGKIGRFEHPRIPAELQAKYLNLLNTYIEPK